MVISSTHGFWILKIGIAYGQQMVKKHKEDLKNNRLINNNPKMLYSPIFISSIRKTVLEEGPEAAVDNFERFLYQLYVTGGKITRLLTIAKKKAPEREFPINSPILSTIRMFIKNKIESQEFIDRSLFMAYDITWSPDVIPFDRPYSRNFFAAFFYNNEAQRWVSLSMYGPALGIYSLSASEIAPEDGIPYGLWDETDVLEPSTDDTATFRIVTWGEVDPSSGLYVGFQNDPTNVPGLHRRTPGVAIMLLTSKGFLLVWYNAALFLRITSLGDYGEALRAKTKSDLKEKLLEAVREFNDARGLRIITLASRKVKRNRQEENFLYERDFLDQCLLIVQKETTDLFKDENNRMTRLILGSTRLTGAQQRFITQALRMDDKMIVAIYYGGVLQFTIMMDGSREIESYNPLRKTAEIGKLHATWIETSNDVLMLDC